MRRFTCVGRRPTRTLRLWVAALFVSLVASGCSGVPTSSLPQVVRTVAGTGVASATPTVRPDPGDDARTTVTKFLQAQVTNDKLHQAAKAFLTPGAASKWQDGTVTIVNDYRVGYPDAGNVVPVRGQVVGTLDTNGIYTPTLSASGLSADKAFQFTVTEEGTQWQISDPPTGLIVTQKDFLTAFHRRSLFFFNQDETKLVPDLRYSPLDGQSLASWILEQLIAGPQQNQNGLRNEFPDQVDPQRAKVTLSQPISVQLPGLSQADSGTVDRIAAEIAYSFDQFAPSTGISLFDGTTLIRLSSSKTEFTSADFEVFDPIPAAVSRLYYLRDGALMNAQATAVAGKGARQYPLVSVAVAGADGNEQIAGLTTDGATLYLGSAPGGLSPMRLSRAATSRPEWVGAPANEVWLGEGTALVRVIVGGTRTAQTIAFTSSGSDLSSRRVNSVRLSPEGSRIALVLTDTGGSGSVWVGSVVRAGQTVQVEGLHQITPRGWNVRDVAWAADGTALRAIGSENDGPQIEIWALNVDGSAPTQPSSDNLPNSPDWIAATTDGTTWVSVTNRIWKEGSLGGWMNPFAVGQPNGTAPVYSVG